MRGLLFLVAIGPMVVSVALAGDAPSQVSQSAAALDKAAKLSGGLCVMPQATMIDAIDLARSGRWIVLAQSTDAEMLSGLRKEGLARGLLGRTLYVEKAPPDALAMADGFADVVWLTETLARQPDDQQRAEWMRALAPGHGALVVGKPSVKTREFLPATPELIARCPAAKGADAWTHRAHGADNNLVSADTTVRMPLMTAWYGLPLHYGFWGGTVVADNGRLYTLHEQRAGGTTLLIARRLGNGVILWQKSYTSDKAIGRFHSGLHTGRSCMVAEGDRLWLIDGDGVERLDGETGERLARVAGPQPKGQVKWIAVADGHLAVLSGDLDDQFFVVHHAVSGKPFGRELAVYRTSDGQRVWGRSENGDVDQRMLAIRDGKLFYHITGQGTFCRTLADGKEQWTNRDAKTVEKIDATAVTGEQINQTLAANASLFVAPGGVVIGQTWRKDVVVLDPKSGRELWSVPMATIKSGRIIAMTALDKHLYTGRGTFDLTSGEKVGTSKMLTSGCGVTAAVNGMFVTCFSSVSDIATGKLLRFNDVKSQCDIGSIVSEGHVVSPGVQCSCGVKIMGARTLVSAPAGFDPHAAPANANRLTKASQGEPSSPREADNLDWPTLAHDAARSGASGVSVATAAKLLWQTPATPAPTALGPALATAKGPVFEPTPAIAVGDLAWYADAAGCVRCLNSGKGKEQWSLATGARLFAPPTYWKGRLYVGGGDGRVYCLDAASGKLLWQFDAAPKPWRMMWYGHLVSVWPLVGGVAIHDGTLYAVAGFQDNNGIHAYAIDPLSGAVRWERHDAGKGTDGVQATASSLGTIAIGGGRLWIASATAGPASFDLKTGKPLLVPGGEDLLWGGALKRGTALSVVDDTWVLQGGRRLSACQEDPPANENFEGVMAWPIADMIKADAGQGQAVGIELISDGMTFLPAHDGDLLLGASRGNLIAFSWDRLQQAVKAVPSATVKQGPRKAPPPFVWSSILAQRKKTPMPEGALWGPLANRQIEAVAIGKDVVVCAGGTAAKPAKGGAAPGEWRLLAYDRQSGTEKWSVALPRRVVADGVCLTRDGRILVAMADGSIAGFGSK